MAAASEPTGIAEWRKARRRAAIALLAVILLAAGLRLYRLDEQSIWADEWPNVAHLDAPDALSYVRLIQLMYPEQAHACLYYFAQYWWARAAGGSLAGLRLLPVATSLATVPLLFLLVSLLFGRGPGLIAALFFALSPQHIWHAQEIRPYAQEFQCTLDHRHASFIHSDLTDYAIGIYGRKGLAQWRKVLMPRSRSRPGQDFSGALLLPEQTRVLPDLI